MKKQSALIGVFTVLSIVILSFINFSAYQFEGITKSNLCMSLGVLLFLIAHFMVILKKPSSPYVQIVGLTLVAVYLFPQYFKLLLVIVKGDMNYLFTFISFSLVLLMLSVIVAHSIKLMRL
ncbi:MAG: hypothetical protein M9887_05215 [Chitinophagales bacterium]|nr:hypothetical protein [Chitinophagales bacterium]